MNVRDNLGQTPLIYYAKHPVYRGEDSIPPEQVVQFLEGMGANFSYNDNGDRNALWWARYNRNNTLVRILEEKESQRLKSAKKIPDGMDLSGGNKRGKRKGRKTRKGRKGRKAHTRRRK